MTKNDRKYKTRSERNKETQSEIEDQGKNQKKYLFVVLALIIIILIILYSIFSNSADETTEDTANEVQTTEVTINESSENSESFEESTDTSEDTTSDSSEEESTEETSEENSIDTESLEEAGLELVEPESNDAIGAYTGEWDPIGTEQTGEHATSYAEGSQDRIEIKRAAAAVTGLNPDAMIEHWVGNDGTADGVYATVSDAEQTEHYRVHLQWQDGAGWQPTVVEILD